MTKVKQRVFSGIQPTGNLHLGNYLGAVANWVRLQDEHDAIFCVVDLHAITIAQNPEDLRKNIIEAARVYLAAGINPAKSTIFAQSDVSAHAELCWILNTIARMGDMEKMTQFKDKSARGDATRASVGLFDYPVLMAADILLYDTAVVPVGEDQVQHVELARTLARRFNTQFGETFVVPEAVLQKEGARIMGLDDPTKKMSKSADSAYNYIALTDGADTIRKKIKKAVTDSGSEIVYTTEKPALANLINIYHLLSGISIAQIEQNYIGKGYGDFKNDLAEVIVDFIIPFQDKIAQISDDDVRAVLATGKARAEEIAQNKLQEVKTCMGLGV